MILDFLNAIPEVVCGFMSDNGVIYHGNAYDDYIPIISEMEFKTTSEIKLIHKSDVCLNIESYDERASNKNLNQNIKINKKLEVTANDINVGATELVLNFTDMTLVIYNKYNIPQMLVPLDNKVLKDKYRGKVVFMTIHRLNNPNIVSDVYNSDRNYLSTLKESTKFKKNINNKYEEFHKVVNFAEKCWKETDYLSSDYRCNSIKIVTIWSINSDQIMPGNETSALSIVIPNKNLLITRANMFDYQENPGMHNDVDLNQFKNDIIPGANFMYIIDNEDNISDRYSNQFGDTKKIPKFKSKQQQISGLYVVCIEENFTLTVNKFVPMSEIDTCDFVYKTQEEAEQGADKTALFAQEIREKELSMQHTIVQARENEASMQRTLLQAKEKYEVNLLELRKENDAIKAESERKSKENDLRFTELKRDIERTGMNDKIYYERNHYGMKNNYERESYSRDSALETLKTVGGICGVAVAGIALYGKFAGR